jgi:hypothetical protein
MLLEKADYSKAMDACLEKLSQTHRIRLEQVGDRRTYLVAGQKERTRIVFGEGMPLDQLNDQKTIVVGWGERPMAYATSPSSNVSYFDLRFETHSRILDELAYEFKGYLEASGWEFREFGSQPSPVGRRSRPRPLPRRLAGAIRRRITIGS